MIDWAGLAILIAFSGDSFSTAPAGPVHDMWNLTFAGHGQFTVFYLPAGKERHQPSYSREIQPVALNELPDTLNNPQIIDGIEAAFSRGSKRNDNALFFVKSKGRY